MVEIMERLKDNQQITFQSLFDELSSKYDIIVAFLAILELMRLRAVKVFQVRLHGEIRIIALVGEVQINDLTT